MRKTVLIAVDDRETRDILAGLVQDRNLRPFPIGSAVQLWSILREVKPDLVLVDAMLADQHGFGICDQLKRDRETRCVPVLLMTALGDARRLTTHAMAGADEYLITPFSAEQLYAAMDRALIRSRGGQ